MQLIGVGTYGKVWKGQLEGKLVALKEINEDLLINPSES